MADDGRKEGGMRGEKWAAEARGGGGKLPMQVGVPTPATCNQRVVDNFALSQFGLALRVPS